MQSEPITSPVVSFLNKTHSHKHACSLPIGIYGGQGTNALNRAAGVGAGVMVGFTIGDEGISGFPNGFRNDWSGHFGKGRAVG
jgi:hypothetical protein